MDHSQFNDIKTKSDVTSTPWEKNSPWGRENIWKNEADEKTMGVFPATGEWSGKKGDSTWIPDKTTIPDPENGKGGNPDKLTWEEILKKYGIDGIVFEDGYPVFSPVLAEINGKKAEVEIKNFTSNRSDNFDQADLELAKKTGKSPEEIKQWRKENGYTWHEHQDCKTMQLVPKEIHNNTPHSGGISIAKQKEQTA